jgi:hypothetical protein
VKLLSNRHICKNFYKTSLNSRLFKKQEGTRKWMEGELREPRMMEERRENEGMREHGAYIAD